MLTNLLVRHGDPREAPTYGAESYGRNPQPMLAATVARAAGALGDEETAVAWLRRRRRRHAGAWPPSSTGSGAGRVRRSRVSPSGPTQAPARRHRPLSAQRPSSGRAL